MKKINTIFFDVGGVCLTNGWDHISREKATEKFSLDYEDVEKKHKRVFKHFEKGKISLDQYLNEVIFTKRRKFNRAEFKEFMFSQSKAHKSTMEVLHKLALSKKYYLATINNESFELNQYRINKFKLYKYFTNFFSSCYLGVRKPEPEIFFRVLHILQKDAGECLFIDDREENYQSAKNNGLNSILLESPSKLRLRLKEINIKI